MNRSNVDGPGLPGSFVASFQVAGARFSFRGAPHLRNLLANDSCECRGALLQEGNGVPKFLQISGVSVVVVHFYRAMVSQN